MGHACSAPQHVQAAPRTAQQMLLISKLDIENTSERQYENRHAHEAHSALEIRRPEW
jgi:hypothetical protein